MLKSPFGQRVVKREEQLSSVLEGKHTQIRERPPLRRYYSSTLRSVFYLGLLLLASELFVSMSRPNFLGVMAALGVAAMFWLNYFDEHYNKFIMVLLTVSSLFDAIWMILRMEAYCNIGPFSEYSTLQRPMHLANAVISLMGNAVLKVVLAVMLIPYRGGTRSTEFITCIKAFSTWEIQLTNEPNPISKFFRN